MLVIDAAFVVAALVDGGREGTWADGLLGGEALAAPHLMPVEVTADAASMAHADLLALRIELFPYAPFSSRVWELRGNVTCYDGWYVALAEALDAPLATLDARLSRASGPRCRFQLPPPG